MNPTELINDLLKRSDGSLDQLKLHYGPLIRYVIAPILPDDRDREEVFNDILVQVWDRVDQFDPSHGNWSNWLSTIARNAAIDQARRNPPPGAELTETIPAPNSDPEQELIRKERQRALHTALNSLESSDKALFYRKYYYRQSTAQIAAEYDHISVADMCRQMGVSRRLYYTYFPDKESCLISMIDRILHESMEAVPINVTKPDLVRDIIIEHLCFWREHKHF